MGTFGAYSKYYDLLYKDKDYAGEVAYISSLLEEHAPDGRSILELGCGTGRHAAMLAEKKWIVHGIDLSTDMLKAAQERKRSRPSSIGDRLRFSVGDVRDFDTGEQYDAVLSLFHVVSYQNANDDVLAMFRNAAAHLKPGGVFVFDYWYGPAVLTDRPAVRVKRMHSAESLFWATSARLITAHAKWLCTGAGSVQKPCQQIAEFCLGVPYQYHSRGF